MRIIIDKGIPFLEGVFGSGFEVLYLSPEEITKDSVCEADALFVRTRTKINRELLDGSKVRFVATATIGFDHIDQDFCREAGIYWVSCPGCNAQAVCDYIDEAIQSIESKKDNEGIQAGNTAAISGSDQRARANSNLSYFTGWHISA